MSQADEIHEKLISKQPVEELKRKQKRAKRKEYWTQEDMDLADREAEKLSNIKWD